MVLGMLTVQGFFLISWYWKGGNYFPVRQMRKLKSKKAR